MLLYLVRHAQSKANELSVTSNAETKLTAYGKKQAQSVARRFKKISIDIIVSSHYTRARQTAEIIQKTTNKKLIFCELLREIKRPTNLEGLNFQNPESLKVREEMKKNIHDASWHYQDEDNFFDLRARAFQFLNWISGRSEERIVAISHGIFLKTLIFTMMLGDRFTPDFFHFVEHFFLTRNTGITLCEYTNYKGWKLITFNDHAHLG